MNIRPTPSDIHVADVCDFLDRFAPARWAEPWDNVGLLVGRRQRPVRRIMTCLTVTPLSVGEAIERGTDLIVSHHPLPFRAVKQITDETTVGRLLLDLIQHQIAVYSPHTAFDSAAQGINQRLAEMLELHNAQPLRPQPDSPAVGTGRFGQLLQPAAAANVAQRCKAALRLDHVRLVDSGGPLCHSVAIACGSGGELLADAQARGCQLFVTGETSFHSCLEAEATGMGLILLGHFASERFAVEALAEELRQAFPGIECWPSTAEKDPLRTV